MAHLNKLDVERLYLPSTKELPADHPDVAWVDFIIGGLVTSDILEADGAKTENYNAAAIIARRIKDWSFASEDGVKEPITMENVARLDIMDFSFLAEKIPTTIKGMSPEEKKT